MKVVSESRVTWATSVPILVFLGLSVLELGPMYTTDVRQTDIRLQTKASLNASALWGGGIIKKQMKLMTSLSIVSNTKYQTQQTLCFAFLLQKNFSISRQSQEQSKCHQ